MLGRWLRHYVFGKLKAKSRVIHSLINGHTHTYTHACVCEQKHVPPHLNCEDSSNFSPFHVTWEQRHHLVQEDLRSTNRHKWYPLANISLVWAAGIKRPVNDEKAWGSLPPSTLLRCRGEEGTLHLLPGQWIFPPILEASWLRWSHNSSLKTTKKLLSSCSTHGQESRKAAF